jgi:hypothetical protein
MFRLRAFPLVVLFAAFVFGCQSGTSPKSSNEKKPPVLGPPAFSMQATDLYKEWSENRDAANAKYTGKVLEIEGKIKTMDGWNERTTISLDVGKTTNNVGCVMPSPDACRKVAPPQIATFRGIYDAKGFWGPLLIHCEIVGAGPTQAKEIGVKELAAEYEKAKAQTIESRKGQWIIVEGEVVSKNHNDLGAPAFRLKGTENTSVIANFTAHDSSLFGEIRVGQKIEVIGEATEFNHLDDAFSIMWCIVLKK